MADEIDRAAQRVYNAAMRLRSDPTQPYEPWESLSAYWQRLYRTMAAAVLDESRNDLDTACSVIDDARHAIAGPGARVVLALWGESDGDADGEVQS